MKWKRIKGGVVLFFVTALIVFVWLRESRPEGLYDEPNLGVLYFSYYEIKDGNIWLIYPESRQKIIHDPVGTYYKENGRWMMEYSRGGVYYLESSFFGFQIVETNGHPVMPFRKRLWFRPSYPEQQD